MSNMDFLKERFARHLLKLNPLELELPESEPTI